MDEQVRILLCEDEENLGTILKELLESKHYKVDLCADGEQGWKAFRASAGGSPRGAAGCRGGFSAVHLVYRKL